MNILCKRRGVEWDKRQERRIVGAPGLRSSNEKRHTIRFLGTCCGHLVASQFLLIRRKLQMQKSNCQGVPFNFKVALNVKVLFEAQGHRAHSVKG